jgi:hypothetical protein
MAQLSVVGASTAGVGGGSSMAPPLDWYVSRSSPRSGLGYGHTSVAANAAAEPRSPWRVDEHAERSPLDPLATMSTGRGGSLACRFSDPAVSDLHRNGNLKQRHPPEHRERRQSRALWTTCLNSNQCAARRGMQRDLEEGCGHVQNASTSAWLA